MKVSESVSLWISWSVHSLELFNAAVKYAMTSALLDSGFYVNHKEIFSLLFFNEMTASYTYT